MKLFIDGRWLSDPHNGVGTYILGLIEALLDLKRQGGADDLELVIGIRDESVIPGKLRNVGITFLSLGWHSMPWRVFVLPFVLAKQRIDVAHFQYICPFVRLGTRYVTSIHDVLFLSHPELFGFWFRTLRHLLFWLSSRCSDLVVTISEGSVRDIHKYLGYKGWLELVYIGVETSIRSGNGSMPRGFGLFPGKFILTVGRVEQRKNYTRLSNAYTKSRLLDRGVQLVIVGGAVPETKAEADRFSAVPGVQWLQRVGDEELNWLYRNAAGFVFPSICEGYGIPLVEALNAGLPCATSSTYPLADVIKVCNAEFDPYNEDEIAAALITLAERPEQKCGVAETLGRYSWRSSAVQYLALLRQAIKS